MARGDFKIIGATTNEEYEHWIQKDKALEKMYDLKDTRSDDINEFIQDTLTNYYDENDFSSAEVFRNSLNFFDLLNDDEIQIITSEISYKRAEYNLEQGEVVNSYYDFLRISDYSDSIQRAESILAEYPEVFYHSAITAFNEENYSEAEKYFSLIPDYEESENYLHQIANMNSLKKMWGTYRTGMNGTAYIFVLSYGKIERCQYYSENIETGELTYAEASNGEPCYIADIGDEIYIFTIEDDEVWMYNATIKQEGELSFTTDDRRTPIKISYSTDKLKAPQIGMTEDELKRSTWGSPKDKNVTTTVYGVSEQWVYDSYRYVYLEDGIVTAIQEY